MRGSRRRSAARPEQACAAGIPARVAAAEPAAGGAALPRRLRRMTDPDPVPVVGMVGAGQLARMTCPAAAALGIGFRVLAAAAGDSAALVCAGAQTGDYRSAADLLAFAGGCDVLTFDHEHVPAAVLAALEQVRRGAAARPGRARLRPGQARHARAADRIGGSLPGVRPGGQRAAGGGLRRRARLAGGAQGGQRRLRRQGRLGLRVPGRGRRGAVPRHRPARRGARRLRAGARRPGRPRAERAGRRLPGGADRAAGRRLPRGARPRARPRAGRRRWPRSGWAWPSRPISA